MPPRSPLNAALLLRLRLLRSPPSSRSPSIDSLDLHSPHLHPRPLSFTTAWSGRKVEDHVVNRTDAKDVQSESSQAALKEKQEGVDESHSHGVAQKSGGQNQKAKKEHPKAPEPVIGMNDERGQKG